MQISEEIMEEYKQIAEKTKDEKPALHNLEGAVSALRQEFEQRVSKAALEEEQNEVYSVLLATGDQNYAVNRAVQL